MANALMKGRQYFVYLPMVRGLTVSVIAALEATTQQACDWQFISIGLVSLLSSILIVVFRPYRVGVMQFIHAITNMFMAGLDTTVGHCGVQSRHPTIPIRGFQIDCDTLRAECSNLDPVTGGGSVGITPIQEVRGADENCNCRGVWGGR